MDLSILHLSDLHRDASDLLANTPLLDSLQADRRRYTLSPPAIRPPDVIVVSGDIVYGVASHDDHSGDALKRQYSEAMDFLHRLADFFVNGDKNRVVLVPGNHDVDARQFQRSLSPLSVTAGRTSEIAQKMFQPHSGVRWCWSELQFFQIDWADYNRRFDAFRDFYNAFYEGSRSYSDDPDMQLDLFDIADIPVTFVGFNTCYHNDPMNRAAAINPECMARASAEIRHPNRRDRLAVAVWHHNINGAPLETDYLDSDCIQLMIDRGFVLGLHGHQHRPESLHMHFKYGADRHMVVVAAGTLCGKSAPHHGRSYNLLELDLDSRKGRLHIREAGNHLPGLPIWCARGLPSEAHSHYDFTLDAPSERPPDSRLPPLAAAQDAMENGDFSTAASHLTPLVPHDDLARRLLLECLVRLKDVRLIADTFYPPRGVDESLHLMDALWELRAKDRLRRLLSHPVLANAQDLSVVEIRDKYAARLAPR